MADSHGWLFLVGYVNLILTTLLLLMDSGMDVGLSQLMSIETLEVTF